MHYQESSPKETIEPELFCIDKNYFGEALKELRIERKLTQQGISDLLEIKQAQWSGYELGKNRPSLDTIILISNKLNIHPLVLVAKALDKSKFFIDSSKELSFKEYGSLVEQNIEGYRRKKLKITASLG